MPLTPDRDIAHIHILARFHINVTSFSSIFTEVKRRHTMTVREDTPGLILLVEDNRGIAEMVGEFLERRGFSVDYASDGVTGLHLAVTNSYDVVVLDLMLPGMDGMDLCRKLRHDA